MMKKNKNQYFETNKERNLRDIKQIEVIIENKSNQNLQEF